MCTTAAPARAASIAEVAICSGVTGTWGLLVVVSPAPVMAHVMKAFQFTDSSPCSLASGLYPWSSGDYAAARRPSRTAQAAERTGETWITEIVVSPSSAGACRAASC